MRIAVLLLLVFAACVHPQQLCPDGRSVPAGGQCTAAAAPGPPEKKPRPIALTFIFQSLTQVGGRLQERTLAAGETLRSGDQYSLRVDVDQPAYVYVMQKLTETGTAAQIAVLYPQKEAELVEPGGLQRIPRSGYFQLQPQPGRERVIREDLFVIADKRPLPVDQAMAIAQRQLEQYEKDHPAPPTVLLAKAPVRNKPKVVSDGGLLGDEVPGTKSSAYVDLEPQVDPETGARVIHFPFLHQIQRKRSLAAAR